MLLGGIATVWTLCGVPRLARGEVETPAAPTLATCGGTQGTEEMPWGRIFHSRFYAKQNFAPKEQPATLMAASELEMLQKGYVAIGWLEVSRFTHFIDRYKPGDGTPLPGPSSLPTLVLEEAAKRGAEAFTQFGAEEPVYENLPEPRPAGEPSGAVRGTILKGTLWLKAPARSRAQLVVYAAQHNKLAVLERALASHPPVDVDTREPRFCHTAIIEASIYGHSEAVRLLIAARAKLELADINGTTALGYAAFPHDTSEKSCRAAQLLRQAGAKEPKEPVGPFSFDFPKPRRCPK